MPRIEIDGKFPEKIILRKGQKEKIRGNFDVARTYEDTIIVYSVNPNDNQAVKVTPGMKVNFILEGSKTTVKGKITNGAEVK